LFPQAARSGGSRCNAAKTLGARGVVGDNFALHDCSVLTTRLALRRRYDCAQGAKEFAGLLGHSHFLTPFSQPRPNDHDAAGDEQCHQRRDQI
jgi:hypothetical protein